MPIGLSGRRNEMNVREQVIKELEKTQKENEARRYERAKEIVGILWEKYTTKTFNYSNEQQFSFEEYCESFFPPKMFQRLKNNGVIDEYKPN